MTEAATIVQRLWNFCTVLRDDGVSYGDCTYSGRETYEDPAYTGLLDAWSNCGAEGSLFEVIAVTQPNTGEIIVVEIVSVTTGDLEASEEIKATFFVTNP